MEIRTRGLSGLEEAEKRKIRQRLDKFGRIKPGKLYVKLDCDEKKEKWRGANSYTCRVQADTGKGLLNAVNYDFGAVRTLNGAFRKIQRQLARINRR